MPAPEAAQAPTEPSGDRTAMMPKRRRTRAQDRAYKVAAERQQNQTERLAREAEAQARAANAPPPPF